jgi:PAS domain S-box-containing protein
VKTPPSASDEIQRLAALQKYGVLDTPAERELDELTDLAAHICETPIALISLVDQDRQWFKSSYGLTATETPRDISFCGQTIFESEILIVPDTTKDERFSHSPLVTGEMGIRFYAGAPLTAPEGENLGALCVMDREPRVLTSAQTHALVVLSRHVMAQLELRRQKREMTRVNNALLGILEDERIAEKAVRETEELNRSVLDSVLSHIAVLDRDGTIIGTNAAWRKFARENSDAPSEGLARTDVGCNYLNVCQNLPAGALPESRLVFKGLEAVLKGEQENFTLEYPCHTAHRKRWFILSATPLRTSRGGATISHLEITERKLAEQRVAEQADFLDKARDAILVRDLVGTVLFWNQGAQRVYGWTKEETMGHAITDLLYADRKKFADANNATIALGEWHGELQHHTKSRGEITVEARWTLIRDDEGRPKSILAINTDITEKKKIEAQFMRAQRMESIGTLAGGIAHDLNNILAPIMMSIELLKDISTDAQAQDMLETIEVSARRGAEIVRQVLSFARGIEGERVEIQPRHLLRDLEKIIKDTFPKDIRLRFLTPQETWTILGDPTQIHQILLNLCVNARDAMPHGGNLTLEIENCELDENGAALNLQAKPGRYVKFSVTDSGSGIPPELLDKIFEPFFTTKDINKGTGLGLSTVMAIVKSHAGIVNVYSEPGKGTCFTFYIPALQDSIEHGKEQAQDTGFPRGKGELILAVDDEASILTITAQTLRAYGYRVLEATDGADAVAVFAEHKAEIDVVLTDMMMPVMDGSSTIHAIMRIRPGARIIAASGLDAHGGLAALASVGVKHFLTKPYTAGTLLRMLRTIIDEP